MGSNLLELSLPVRERGLKSKPNDLIVFGPRVAPRAGAWIEITSVVVVRGSTASLPVRERGLKSDFLPSAECKKR